MDSSKHAIAICFIGVSGLLTLPALGRADTPDRPVREGYTLVMKDTSGNDMPWRPPHRDRLMSKSLAALLARDAQYMDEAGDVGHLDYDPFSNGNGDPDVKKLRLTVARLPTDGQAEIKASFQKYGKPMTVAFKVVLEDGVWRIDDIIDPLSAGKQQSIRALLAQPYDCGSFMNKPCKHDP